MPSPSKGGPGYSFTGRLGFITGSGANGFNVAIRPDHREGMVEIGSERFTTTDPVEVRAMIRALQLLERRLTPPE